MHDAYEMFKKWKGTKSKDKNTIAPDRFNARYDKGYKEWLKKDIQNISSQTPRSFRNVTDREAKEVAELQDVKKDSQEVYAKFVDNQDTLEKATKEVERLRRGYDDFVTCVKEKNERMRYKSLEDKGCLDEGFLLILRYMFQQYKT